jgi:hypothetical protein
MQVLCMCCAYMLCLHSVAACPQVIVPNGPLTAWFLSPEEREALHQQVSPSTLGADLMARWH